MICKRMRVESGDGLVSKSSFGSDRSRFGKTDFIVSLVSSNHAIGDACPHAWTPFESERWRGLNRDSWLWRTILPPASGESLSVWDNVNISYEFEARRPSAIDDPCGP
jgi:hypothetical protein